VLYDYNDVNLVTSIVEPPAGEGEPAAERTTSFDYNAHNSRTETRYPNGVVQKVDYEESKAAREGGREANDTTKIEGVKPPAAQRRWSTSAGPTRWAARAAPTPSSVAC